MRAARTVATIALASALLVPAADAKPKPKPKPKPGLVLAMSNFRFCAADPCTPLDIGYLRPNGAPIAGTDNPIAVTDVKSGTLVRWVYADSLCDVFSCGGHNIWFENGKTGVKKGFARVEQGRDEDRREDHAEEGDDDPLLLHGQRPRPDRDDRASCNVT